MRNPPSLKAMAWRRIKVITTLGILLAGIADQVIKQSLPESFIFKNSQSMFGYFNTIRIIQIIVPILIIAIICVFIVKSKNFWVKLSLFAMAIGGISNLIDRIVWNATIDYLPFFGLARWNLADMLIYVGVGGIILYVTHNTPCLPAGAGNIEHTTSRVATRARPYK